MRKHLILAALISFTSAIPALASVTVNSPANGSTVPLSFPLSASSATCSSKIVTAMGYSFDSSSDTTVISGTSINTQVSTTTGPHTLHVKSWGVGVGCVTDVAITVGTVTADPASVIPAGAVSVSSIETLSNWTATYDGATGGSASGIMNLVTSPSQSGESRQFLTTFSNSGGERYNITFGDDATSQNFFYDAWVYLTSDSGEIGNLEMDLNQTMQNGQTAIFGIQCDGWTSTWDYTENAGTPTNQSDRWMHSTAYCNPRGWGINTWHHVQMYYSRDNSGNVTYHTFWLDGYAANINATVLSAFALGWGDSLNSNFQVDGYGSGGTATVYLDNLTITRW